MASIEENKRITRQWFELINEHNSEALCQITAPTWRMHGGPPNRPLGPEGVHELFRQIGLLEQKWTVEDVIAEGEKVVVRATNICVQEREMIVVDYIFLRLMPTSLNGKPRIGRNHLTFWTGTFNLLVN